VYGGPATVVGEYAVVVLVMVVAAGSEPERAMGKTGLGCEAEAAVCTESTWADWRRSCWELEVGVGGDLRSSFRETETSAYWLMPRLSSLRDQWADSASSWSGGVLAVAVGLEVIVVGLVVVRVLAVSWCDCERLQAINDERRLAVVVEGGDSRAGDGLDITVTSYRGQSEGEYASMDPAMQRKEKRASKGRAVVVSSRQGGYTRTDWWCK
jgi:hypothetical protein